MAYKASSSNSGVSNTPSTSVPAGLAAGDEVVLVASIDNASALFNPEDLPINFAELNEVALTLDGQTVWLGWKRLSGADSGSYTFGDVGVTAGWSCAAFAFSGRHPTDPPVSSTPNTSNAANTSPVTITANGATASQGDDLIWISAPDINTSQAGDGHTPPTDFMERQDVEDGFFTVLSGATRDNVSAGATGNISGTLTLTSGASGWAAFLIRLPAAPSAGGGGYYAMLEEMS